MFQTLTVYLSLLFVMMFCGIYAHRRIALHPDHSFSFWHFEILFPIICFSGIFGMRWGVGRDYFSYLDIYNDSLGGFDNPHELLFAWITNSFASLHVHYVMYFAFISFIQISLLYYAFRNCSIIYPFLAFVLIISCRFMGFMNVIRQELAVCIFIYSLQFVLKKNVWKYYLSILIAFLFHKSAILLILIYPIYQIRPNYFRNIPFQMLLLFFMLFLMRSGSIIGGLGNMEGVILLFGYDHYYYQFGLGGEDLIDNAEKGVGFFITLAVNILIIINSNKIKLYFAKTFPLIGILYDLYFIGVLTKYLTSGSIVLARPFLYFTGVSFLFQAFGFCYFYYTGGNQVRNRLFFMVLALLLVFTFVGTAYRMQDNTMLFTFFWQQ